jgi:Domain of unknown function (DUF3854)/AAA domain
LSADLDHLTTLSAIHPDLVRERGYRHLDAEEAATELLALGFADYQASLGSGLLVPMYDTAGVNGSYQFRPDSPRLRDDKPIKYETPEGAKNMLDVHPRMTQYLGNPAYSLIITEGVKTADSMASLGYVTGALTGAWSWKTRDAEGKSVPLPDLDRMQVKGLRIYLCFDSDARYKPGVQQGLSGLAAYLTGRGAVVSIHLPPGAYGEKVGMDDYLAAAGTVEERTALLNALLAAEAFNPDAIGRTAAELRAEPHTEPDWLIPGVIARQWATLFGGREKSAGKGTLVAYLIGCMERGEDSIFGPSAKASTLAVTEEPRESITEKLEDFDVRDARIVYGWELAHLDWPHKVERIVREALDHGKSNVFLDNISRTAGIEDEGGVEFARAVELFVDECRKHDLTPLADVHHKKGRDSIENKMRGGTALPGAVEVIIDITRIGGAESKKRKLNARGRVRATNWTKVIELNAEGNDYFVPADTGDFEGVEGAHALDDILVLNGLDRDVTVEEFAEERGIAPITARDHLKKLIEDGHVIKIKGENTGKGRAPDRYRVAPPTSDPEDESEPEAEVIELHPATNTRFDGGCPTCGATGDDPCTTKTGATTKRHKTREDG